MDIVRFVTNSDHLKEIVQLPENMLHQQLEVIILPVGDSTRGSGNSQKHFAARGSLSKYANEQFRSVESEAWHKAVEEKYDHR
jgi:hypothetical protein